MSKQLTESEAVDTKEVIGLGRTIQQLFVEANDAGYIPAMNALGQKLGLLPDEIAYYIEQVKRLEDRAYGISPDVRVAARKAVSEAYIYDERLVWIELPTMEALPEVMSILYTKGKYQDLYYDTTVIGTGEDPKRVIILSHTDVAALLKDQYPKAVSWDNDEDFWCVEIDDQSGDSIDQIRSRLEESILGYHRLIEPSDIVFSRSYGDNVQIHNICNPKAFYRAIRAAYDNNPRGGFLDMTYTPDDYAKYQLFIVNAGAAGVAVKPDGEIVSVFKNPKIARRDSVERINQALLIEALRAGGKWLECYDGYLTKMYAEAGFIPICKMRFNDDQASADWNYQRDGRPDVVFMARSGDSVAEVLERQMFGSLPPPEAQASVPYVEDFNQAEKLVQKYLGKHSLV